MIASQPAGCFGVFLPSMREGLSRLRAVHVWRRIRNERLTLSRMLVGAQHERPPKPTPGAPETLRVSFAALKDLFQGRELSLRLRLILLALAVFLPALVAALWVINRAYDSERASLERGLRETTRALSMVIDRELSQRETVARFLAD